MRNRRIAEAVLLLCAALLLLCGCNMRTESEDNNPARLVTQIRVEALPEEGQPYRIYTGDEKISAVLNYINGLRVTEIIGRGPAGEDGAWRITCRYADGHISGYDLHDGVYLRAGDGEWMQIEDEPAGSFMAVLSRYSSDDFLESGDSTAGREDSGQLNKIPDT